MSNEAGRAQAMILHGMVVSALLEERLKSDVQERIRSWDVQGDSSGEHTWMVIDPQDSPYQIQIDIKVLGIYKICKHCGMSIWHDAVPPSPGIWLAAANDSQTCQVSLTKTHEPA